MTIKNYEKTVTMTEAQLDDINEALDILKADILHKLAIIRHQQDAITAAEQRTCFEREANWAMMEETLLGLG